MAWAAPRCAGPVLRERNIDLDATAPLPLERVSIREPLGCGIRAIDAFLTCGRGQRVGIFGGSGVGKSTLIGMMARGTIADLTVLALVGERGREVREFLEDAGTRKAASALGGSGLHFRPVAACCAFAPRWRPPRSPSISAAQGKNVLLVVDSLTRFAMAQREIGLAAGEPPTAKGYTPSVFTMLARLVERAGQFGARQHHRLLHRADGRRRSAGSAGRCASRSLLDGHIMLDRRLASQATIRPSPSSTASAG